MKLQRLMVLAICLSMLVQPDVQNTLAENRSSTGSSQLPSNIRRYQVNPADSGDGAPQKDILGDRVLYDGELGSSPFLGVNWAAGQDGLILRKVLDDWMSETAPITYTLRALTATGDYRVWAAGDGGVLLRLTPASPAWTLETSPVSTDLTALSASSNFDLWAAGKQGVILHSQGAEWVQMDSGIQSDLYAISALGPTQVWAAGAGGLIAAFNGASWITTTLATTHTLRAIYAISGTDVYAAGDGGVLAHYDGSAWSMLTSGVSADLHGLAAISATQVWAVGQAGTILYFDGAVWEKLSVQTAADLYSVQVSSLGGAVVGAQGTVLKLNSDLSWTIMQPAAVSNLYAVTNLFPNCAEYLSEVDGPGRGGGHALRLQPDAWHSPVYDLYCAGQDPVDFTAYDSLDFYFRLSSGVSQDPTFWVSTWMYISQTLHIQDYIEGGKVDEQWRRVHVPLADLAAPDWRMGDVQYIFWNTDPAMPTYDVDDIVLRDTTPPTITLTGPETSTILRLGTSERYRAETIRPLANYSLSSPSDPAYATPVHPAETGLYYHVAEVDNSGTPINTYQIYLRFSTPMLNGESYVLHVENVANASGIVAPPVDFSFVYDDRSRESENIKLNQEGFLLDGPKVGHVGGYVGDLGGAAWAVGDNGVILAQDKQLGWVQAASPVTVTLNAVAATREDDAWAAGAGGTLLHWDGQTWTQAQSPTSQDLRGMDFGPDGVGWAVGAGGVILSYTGQQWQQVSSPVSATLNAVWSGSCEGGLGVCTWAVGNGGVILRRAGSVWVNHPQTVTQEDLFAVEGATENGLRFAGAHGTFLVSVYGTITPYPSFPPTPLDLRALIVDAGNATWIGDQSGRILFSGIYASTPYSPLRLPTSLPIYSLAYQNGRQQWAVGEQGLLLSGTLPGWTQIVSPVTVTLRSVTAVPYGVLRLPAPPPEVIIQDALTARPVFTAPLQLSMSNWYLSGEDLYTFDFSALDVPGSYRAYLPGLGVSLPFEISAHALDWAMYVSARGMYYQRSGMALAAPYAEARFARPASFEWDPAGRKLAAYHHFSEELSPLYNNEPTGAGRDAHGGWYDAGDYNKYMASASISLFYLLSAYDIGGPQQFPDGGWNIPESWNGVPDLLDEARWELDWISRTLESDGGMYFKVTSECWWYDMPETDDRPQFFIGKTTYDTATAAAVLAYGSRLWQPYNSALAAAYLSQSLKAWNFLQTHPANLPANGFTNPPSICTGGGAGDPTDSIDADNKAWAAIELYRATGEAAYLDYFEAWWRNPVGVYGGIPYLDQLMWAYLDSGAPNRDPLIVTQVRQAFLVDANELLRLTYDSPYGVGFRLDVPDWVGWGHFTQSLTYAHKLLLAWHITGEKKYYTAAQLNVNQVLGDNPLSMSFITGLGVRYPQHPLQGQSMFDTVTEPVPGIPIPGVYSHLSNGNGLYREVQSDNNNYPAVYDTLDPYPVLRRYVDYPWLIPMSETGIALITQNAAVFGLLAQPLSAPPGWPQIYLPVLRR